MFKNLKLIWKSLLFVTFLALLMLAASAFLRFSELFLNVWEKLMSQSEWFILGYSLSFILFLMVSIWLLLRFLRRIPKTSNWFTKTNRNTNSDESTIEEPRVTFDEVQEQAEQLKEKQVNIDNIEYELEQLNNKNGVNKDIVIIIFGEISSGKSSLIKSLLPDSQAKVSVLGGTTREIHQYEWHSPLGEKIIIIDTPGFDEVEQTLDQQTQESVYQSHLVLYVCEGDLTAKQYQHITEVNRLSKPCVVAINKVDTYTEEDLVLVKSQVQEKLNSINPELSLVSMQTGGTREVTLVYPDGTEKTEVREKEASLEELLAEVSLILESQSLSHLESLRKQALLSFIKKQLDQEESKLKEQSAKKIVQSSTQKAVVAAMASITPGTDLLIQGYLGMSMVKDLCVNYDVPATEVDIEKLLSLLQKNTIGVMPILLGLAGNAFKAFPGVGTITGGVLHAICYGLIFDSIGRAVSLTLATHGKLSPELVENLFQEKLIERVEYRTYQLAKMVVSKKFK